MSNEQSEQHENNAVDVAVEKINNTNNIPTTEMTVPYSIYRKFNDMLEQLFPNYDERIEKRQEVINKVFLIGINNISNSMQQHQQQHCFFVENGKTPMPHVLENYVKLAFVLQNGSTFPNYREMFLRNTVKHTLNVTDDRTEKRYLGGILNYCTKLHHTSGYNVAGFCEAFSESFKCKAGQNLDDYMEL